MFYNLESNNFDDFYNNLANLALFNQTFANLHSLIKKLDISEEIKNEYTRDWQKTIEIWPVTWTTEGMEKIANLIKLGTCPDNLSIVLNEDNSCDDQDDDETVLNLLLEALQLTDQCPTNLEITTSTIWVPDEFHIRIAALLKAGKLAKQFTYRITCDDEESFIQSDVFIKFGEALMSGYCPESFTLIICDNKMTPGDFRFLIEALASGKAPNHLSLKFFDTADTDEENLNVDNSRLENSDKGDTIENAEESKSENEKLLLMHAITESLSSGKCPPNLTLDFMGNHYGDVLATALAGAIQSGNCPAGLKLNLRNTNISDTGITVLANALADDKCRPDLELDIAQNHFDQMGARALVEALKKPRCPQKLTLDFGGKTFDVPGVQAILSTIATGQYPSNLHLLIEGKYRTFIKPLFDKQKYSDKANLISVLKSGNCLPGLILSIFSEGIPETDEIFGDNEVAAIADALSSGKCPENLLICVMNQDIRERGMTALAKAIESGKCPAKLTLGIRLDSEHSDIFVNALNHKNCPADIKLIATGLYSEVSEAVLSLLKENTKLTYFNYLTELSEEGINDVHLMQSYLLRNKLLYLFPNLAPIIKQIAHNAGLFDLNLEPRAPVAPSLENLAYSHILFKKIKIQQNLPEGISANLQTLQHIQNDLRL